MLQREREREGGIGGTSYPLALTGNIWAPGVSLEGVQSQGMSVEHARAGANQFQQEKVSTF